MKTRDQANSFENAISNDNVLVNVIRLRYIYKYNDGNIIANNDRNACNNNDVHIGARPPGSLCDRLNKEREFRLCSDSWVYDGAIVNYCPAGI